MLFLLSLPDVQYQVRVVKDNLCTLYLVAGTGGRDTKTMKENSVEIAIAIRVLS